MAANEMENVVEEEDQMKVFTDAITKSTLDMPIPEFGQAAANAFRSVMDEALTNADEQPDGLLAETAAEKKA